MVEEKKIEKPKWQVVIFEDDEGNIKTVMDGDVSVYKLIGYYSVEIEYLKKKSLVGIKE